MPTRSERPRKPRQIKGKWLALVLALAVQLGFLAVMVFSVTWQNKPPQAVSAELYAPPSKVPVATPARPAPETPPVVPPPVVPPPTPVPTPPVPAPKAVPVPVPKVERPDPKAADIALKARQEEERRKKAEAERKEADKKARDAKEADDKRKADERREADEKRTAEVRERQQRETEALRAQADREAQSRAQADREAQSRAQAEKNAQTAAAEASARAKAEADWIRRIQAKVKGNVIVPTELAGNPEAIFDVVQLPTGEIIEATLRKSSGSRAYDDAVQRAILKSSPLPRPERPDLFQRTLALKFRPAD